YLKVVERENWCKERLSYALRTAKYETRTLGGVRGAPWAYSSRPSTRLGFRVLLRPVSAFWLVSSSGAMGQPYSLADLGRGLDYAT
ncbi:MAG: hypothetical protein AAF551_09690, partial [Bacteroidota bacterium]